MSSISRNGFISIADSLGWRCSRASQSVELHARVYAALVRRQRVLATGVGVLISVRCEQLAARASLSHSFLRPALTKQSPIVLTFNTRYI